MTDAALLVAAEQEDLFGNTIGAIPGIDRQHLGEALATVITAMTLDDVVGIITNRYNEVIEYLALSQGERAGQKISLLFNPHRLDTRTADSNKSIYEALRSPEFHSGLARATIHRRSQGRQPDLFYQTIQLGINGVGYVNEFPPHVARDICLRYRLNKDSAVLDPCAGWGGRLIGCSVVAGLYVGYEPATRTANGLWQLTDFINTMNRDFVAEIECKPYEDSAEDTAAYDLAITSPPYYDTEIYSDEPTNSLNRYDTFETWCEGFYLPLIDKTMRQLKDRAAFIINIGDRKWPLSDVLRDHAASRYTVTELYTYLSNGSSGNKRDPSAGEKFYEIRHR